MEGSSRYWHDLKSVMATKRNITILLADDSKFLRLATERALARAGYEVLIADDGEQALRIAHEKMPHVVLLDMLLPKVSGLDVLKALKKDPGTAGNRCCRIYRSFEQERRASPPGWRLRLS